MGDPTYMIAGRSGGLGYCLPPGITSLIGCVDESAPPTKTAILGMTAAAGGLCCAPWGPRCPDYYPAARCLDVDFTLGLYMLPEPGGESIQVSGSVNVPLCTLCYSGEFSGPLYWIAHGAPFDCTLQYDYRGDTLMEGWTPNLFSMEVWVKYKGAGIIDCPEGEGSVKAYVALLLRWTKDGYEDFYTHFWEFPPDWPQVRNQCITCGSMGFSGGEWWRWDEYLGWTINENHICGITVSPAECA